MRYTTFGIFAHINSGKTTLTERILFEAGLLSALGSIEDGTTESDFLPEEIAHGISIQNTVYSFDWKSGFGDSILQVIDTPGHIDFREQVRGTYSLIDFALVILDANSAVQSQARLVIEELKKRNIPILFFLNKMDIGENEYLETLVSLEQILESTPPCLFHTSGKDSIASYIHNPNLFNESTKEDILSWSEDQLLALWASKSTLESEKIVNEGLIRGFQEGKLNPVLAGSAKQGIGVRELLDTICFLTSRWSSKNSFNEEPELLFKRYHPKLGKVAYFKNNKESKGSILIGNQNLQPFGLQPLSLDLESPMQFVGAGQIFASAILPSFESPFLETFFPKPNTEDWQKEALFSVNIEPESSEDRALWKLEFDQLLWEDSEYRLLEDLGSGQWQLLGRGELHLSIGLERVQRKLKKKLCSSIVSIAKFELLQKMSKKVAFEHSAFETKVSSGTLTAVLEDTASFSKQLAFEVSLSEEWNNVIESAFWEAVACGPKGYEVLGIRCRVIDYSPPSPEVQVSLSFLKVAVFVGLKDFLVGKTDRIGPTTEILIQLDSSQLGVVLAELNRRSAEVIDVSTEGPIKRLVKAKAPSENLLGFSAVLRNMTKGIGISWERTAFTFDAFAVI